MSIAEFAPAKIARTANTATKPQLLRQHRHRGTVGRRKRESYLSLGILVLFGAVAGIVWAGTHGVGKTMELFVRSPGCSR